MTELSTGFMYRHGETGDFFFHTQRRENLISDYICNLHLNSVIYAPILFGEDNQLLCLFGYDQDFQAPVAWPAKTIVGKLRSQDKLQIHTPLTRRRQKVREVLQTFPRDLVSLLIKYIDLDLTEYKIGDYVDVRDTKGVWYGGRIRCAPNHQVHSVEQWVHIFGHASRSDRAYSVKGIAPLGTHTYIFSGLHFI